MADYIKKSSPYDLVKTFTTTTIIVSALGYIDYITGEVSIDILYILCLCAVRWYTNAMTGILCVIEIICAKVVADYFDHIPIDSHLYEWNTFSYFCMYLVVCILMGNLKKVLSN